MKDDPLIDAIRKVRHDISAAVGHDPRKLVAYFREVQERHRGRLISQFNQLRAQPADEKPSPKPQPLGA
jgi:hypothetical protein